MATFEVNRVLIPITLSCLIGISFALFLQTELWDFFVSLSILCGVWSTIFSSFLRKNIVFFLICLLSFLHTELVLHQYQTTTFHFRENEIVYMEMELVGSPKPTKHPGWMEVSVSMDRVHTVSALLVYKSPAKASEQPLHAGDQVRGFVKVNTFKLNQVENQDRFDIWKEIHVLKQPRFVLTFVNKRGDHSVLLPFKHSLRQNILQSIYQRINHVTKKPDTEFIAGLLFGDTSGMSKDATFAFSILGISHILAVSGMNIELLIRPILWTFRTCRLPYRIACGVTCLVISCFGWLAGGGPSVLRAVISGNVWLISILLNRKFDALTALSFSCLICLWIEPLNLTDVGFQFSFIAALFLILFANFFEKSFKKISILKILSANIYFAATIATLPIQLYVFQQWSPYSIVANLLYELLIPIVMILILCLIGCVYVFYPIAFGIGWIIDKFIWLLRVPPVWVLQHQGAYFFRVQPYEAIWFFFMYVFATILLLSNNFKNSEERTRHLQAKVNGDGNLGEDN